MRIRADAAWAAHMLPAAGWPSVTNRKSPAAASDTSAVCSPLSHGSRNVPTCSKSLTRAVAGEFAASFPQLEQFQLLHIYAALCMSDKQC